MSALQQYKRLWVFSDLHLVDPQSKLYQGFLSALDEPNSAADAVVFAGDIFEIFVGNSQFFQQKHADFIQKLKELSAKKVKLFYIQGNHDFHLESAFQGIEIQVLNSELVLDKIYIAHGDLIDTSDRGYLVMRKVFRSKVVQQIADVAPGKIIETIASLMARSHEKKEADVGVNDRVRKLFRNFAREKQRQGYDFVVLGHCHDFDELQPFYFNMGYPPVHRQYLFYTSDSNSFQRRIFPGN